MRRTPFQCIGVRSVGVLLARTDPLVLDARDAGSFEQSHIDGAQCLSSVNLSAVLSDTARARPILIYCYHGNASQEYAQILSDFGFSEVYSLEGGYQAWCTRTDASEDPVAAALNAASAP